MPATHTLPDSLQERYELVRGRIAAAAACSGRTASDIYAVAAVTFAEPEAIRQLVELGHRDLGDHRTLELAQNAAMIDEYLARLRVLPSSRRDDLPATSPAVRWHLLGPLQRAKARKVVEHIRLVHSVDSLRVAEDLQQLTHRKEQRVDVLIQVDCGGARGCPLPAVRPLAQQIDTMVNVRVRGLTTAADKSADADETRRVFDRCRELFEEMRSLAGGESRFNLLAMGTSENFDLAIAHGANIVRVGAAIFGPGRPADAAEDRTSAERRAE